MDHNLPYKRDISPEWDFASRVPNRLTHRLHHYPAALFPDLVAKAIAEFGPNQPGRIFDPFCGSGTTLLEAMVNGHQAIGADLNPLARLITKVKTSRSPLEILDAFVPPSDADIEGARKATLKPSHTTRLSTWFQEKHITNILQILGWIRATQPPLLQDALRLTLSNLLRRASFQRNREFKLYRIPEDERETHDFNLLSAYSEATVSTIEALKRLVAAIPDNTPNARVIAHDAILPYTGRVAAESVDLLLTSPPYGDSETTVAYSQFSWLSNMVLGLDHDPPGRLDRAMLGGRKDPLAPLGYAPLDKAMQAIFVERPQRAEEVHAFYSDYLLSIQNAARTVRPGGMAVYVVGNRRVGGIQLDTDAFTAHAFESCGFVHKTTLVRTIKSKRMPYEVSPSNVKGKAVGTMVNEYIVVCEQST